MTDTNETRLTHVDQSGKAQMVDVGSKPDTQREAVARGRVVMRHETLELIQANAFDKGDVLGVARIAGIMGAKNTSSLIPLCHPLPLNKVAVEFDWTWIPAPCGSPPPLERRARLVSIWRR